MTRIALAVVAILIASATWAVPARAQVDQTDMLIAGRAIGFIHNLERGDVRVGIVYDPGIAQSAQQAGELNTIMGNGLRVGQLVLKPVMLPIGRIGDEGVGLFFMTVGIGSDAGKIGQASRTRKIPCVTFDLVQVRNGACVMGVQS